MFILTDIHTYDFVYLNVYSLTISPLNVLANITDCCFLGWYWMKWVASMYCSKRLDFFVVNLL